MQRPSLPWLCGALVLLSVARGTAGAEPDFDASGDAVVKILQEFIRIDTVNPPGLEIGGAAFLRAVLEPQGIPCEIFESEPGRANLVARIKGNGRKKPILLMAHLDVVGVERDKWTVDPFGGVIKEGYIYGRGAIDDKGMGAVCTEVLRMLQRMKVPLERDVIFLAEAGEESATSVGIDYMVSQHWDKIACEFALNEGGRILQKNSEVQYVAVSTTEKVPRPMTLTARGTSGHGSKPLLDNAIVHLSAAVAKIGQWQPPMRLNATTRAYFARLAGIAPPEEAFLYTHLEDPVLGAMIQEKLRAAHPGQNSTLRTSISPNIIHGGFRFNVIPADAEATLDVRALPDEDIEALMATLRQLIDDPAVEVKLSGRSSRKPAPPSGLDTDMFRALERVQTRMFPKAVTLPTMLTGATDSAQLRERGVQAYGVGPAVTEEDSGRVHGNDERVSVAGLKTFLEYVYRAVVELAAAPEADR